MDRIGLIFPFFIVGCGRSGTSLLRGLLNRHPQVAIPLESLFIVDYLRASRRRPVDELLPILIREPELDEWGLDRSLVDLSGVSSIGGAIERLHEMYAQSHGKRRWGQKTPRFVRHTDLLMQHFPEARFIHVVRDPRAVTSSLIRSDVHRSNAWYGARRWKMDVTAGLSVEEEHPGRIRRVHYEQLVQDTESTLRDLAGFLELDWIDDWWRREPAGTEEYSQFYENIHANLDRSTTDRFVDRWMDELSSREVEVIEAVAADNMVGLGYEPTTGALPVTPLERWRFRLDRAGGLLRQASRYLRLRRRYFFHLLWRKWKLGLLWEWIWSVNY